MRNKMNNDDLYIIQSDLTGMIKIGRSKDPQKRLKQLQTGNPNKLKLIVSFKGDGWKEKILHERLRRYRREGDRGSQQVRPALQGRLARFSGAFAVKADRAAAPGRDQAVQERYSFHRRAAQPCRCR